MTGAANQAQDLGQTALKLGPELRQNKTLRIRKQREKNMSIDDRLRWEGAGLVLFPLYIGACVLDQTNGVGVVTYNASDG